MNLKGLRDVCYCVFVVLCFHKRFCVSLQGCHLHAFMCGQHVHTFSPSIVWIHMGRVCVQRDTTADWKSRPVL